MFSGVPRPLSRRSGMDRRRAGNDPPEVLIDHVTGAVEAASNEASREDFVDRLLGLIGLVPSLLNPLRSREGDRKLELGAVSILPPLQPHAGAVQVTQKSDSTRATDSSRSGHRPEHPGVSSAPENEAAAIPPNGLSYAPYQQYHDQAATAQGGLTPPSYDLGSARPDPAYCLRQQLRRSSVACTPQRCGYARQTRGFGNRDSVGMLVPSGVVAQGHFDRTGKNSRENAPGMTWPGRPLGAGSLPLFY